MSHAAGLPVWAALLVAAFLILGAGLTLLGSFGLVRLRSFYDRIHAPTVGVSWGTTGIVIASMILFTVLQSRPVVHEILIAIFVTATTPVTLMLLGRAALYRDRAERNPDVPSTTPPIRALGPSGPDGRAQ
jgi:multicomponent K+:H+ antiporter subunit G